MRLEASAWGVMTSVHNAFVNPLLLSRGAGPLALGVFNSAANLLGFGSGFLGPRLATRLGGAPRLTVAALTLARLALLGVPVLLVLTGGGGVPLLIAVLLVWYVGEGVALPLWTSFLAGLVGPARRGRWLAMRATAAAGASVAVMVTAVVVFRLASDETSFRLAYVVAAVAGLASVWHLRALLAAAPRPAPVAPRSLLRPPGGPGTHRFIGGVFCFWFGAGLIWPILPRYIIDDLNAPTAYFGALAVITALVGVVVPRLWGRVGDARGARAVLLRSGLGTSAAPVLWAVIPTYWLGPLVEVVASASWPGHQMGLTLRASELAHGEDDRPSMLAWTNLAQGAGASMSPLVASVLVGEVGTVPILIASAVLRLAGTAAVGTGVVARAPNPG